MRLRLVPANTGVTWVKLGMQAFRMQPIALTALFFTGMLILSLISSIPLIGVFVGLMLTPCFTLAMMVATAQATQHVHVHFGVLGVAFLNSRDQIIALLTVGAVFASIFLGIAQATSWVDGGVLLKVLSGEAAMTPELMQNTDFSLAMLLMLALYAALSTLQWHAPGLIHWHKVPPVKAMFFSLIACFSNGAAFVIYGLTAGFVAICASMIMNVVAVLLSQLGVPAIMMMSIMVVLSVALFTLLAMTQVFSFRDCFEPPEAAPTPDASLS